MFANIVKEKPAASTFSDAETNLLICIIQNLKEDLKADFDAVASQMGYKSGGIARIRWSQIKAKKISGIQCRSSASPIKKRASSIKKDENASPKKRGSPKKELKGNSKVKGEDHEDDYDNGILYEPKEVVVKQD